MPLEARDEAFSINYLFIPQLQNFLSIDYKASIIIVISLFNVNFVKLQTVVNIEQKWNTKRKFV